MRWADRVKRAAADETGLSLIEIMVALLVMTVGLLALGAGLLSAKRSTFGSQRHAVAVHQAQLALEQMRGVKYDDLALPTGTTPTNPPNDTVPNRAFQTGVWYLTVRANPLLYERLVFSSTGAVPQLPAFNVNGIKGTVRRYVTWRGSCGDQCSSENDSKRITVAVSLDPAGNGAAPQKPVVLSSVVAPGIEGGNPLIVDPAHAVGKSQNFYLYDAQCDATSWVSGAAATATHAAHDTAAQSSTNVAKSSSCWSNMTSGGGLRRPDLMGPRPPLGTASGGATITALPPRFGSDSTYNGAFNPGGIALTRRVGVDCSAPTTYGTDGADATTAANRNTIHRWVTGPFSKDFLISGEVTLNLRTHLVGDSNNVNGAICFTLFRRHEVNSTVAEDVSTPLASGICGPQRDWPQDLYGTLTLDQLRPSQSCDLFVNDRKIPAGDRLGLAVFVPSSSGESLNFFYDDPDTPTNLRVSTTTPCESGGPCPAS